MKDLAEAIIPVIAIICTFGIPGIIIFFIFHNKHQEKMKMIEKGFTPEEAKAYFAPYAKVKAYKPYGMLKWGIILTFLGVGIFIAHILEDVYDISDSLNFSLVLIFGGAGFIVYYLIINKKLKNGNGIAESKPASGEINQ